MLAMKFFEIRNKDTCDAMLIGKIELFEKRVDAIQKSNKKRKNQDNVESQPKRIKIRRSVHSYFN